MLPAPRVEAAFSTKKVREFAPGRPHSAHAQIHHPRPTRQGYGSSIQAALLEDIQV
jgi:hypothetical protein